MQKAIIYYLPFVEKMSSESGDGHSMTSLHTVIKVYSQLPGVKLSNCIFGKSLSPPPANTWASYNVMVPFSIGNISPPDKETIAGSQFSSWETPMTRCFLFERNMSRLVNITDKTDPHAFGILNMLSPDTHTCTTTPKNFRLRLLQVRLHYSFLFTLLVV